jgi:purine catabolism regulator
MAWERPNLPHVSDILDLEEVAAGRPEVLAAADRLSNRVRWVHTHENPDIASLLSGGELLLTTGILLPENRDGLRRYVDSIVGADASGLVVEAGRRFERLPRALVASAEADHLPLVLLRERVRFVRVTEAAHALILSEQLQELRARQEVEESFAELAVEAASIDRVVRETSNLLGRPVILENLVHQPIAFEPGNLAELFVDWEQRSRRLGEIRQARGVMHANDCLIVGVGARGEIWGRLIAVLGVDQPSPREIAILDRAAVALALSELRTPSLSLERHAHDSLIASLAGDGRASADDVEGRLRTLGVPVGRRVFTAIALAFDWREAPWPDPVRATWMRRFVEGFARTARRARVPALVGLLPSNMVGVLLSAPTSASTSPRIDEVVAAAHAAADQIGGGPRTVIGVGASSEDAAALQRSFQEAAETAALAISDGETRPYYRLRDLRLRGLISVLRDDSRLQTFVEAELGPLIAYDEQHGTNLVSTLETLLESGANKAVASRLLALSRPALYERLERIEHILDVSLETSDSRLALHVALVALAVFRARTTDAADR